MVTSILRNSGELKLGDGIYLPNDVAQILRLEYHKVRYLMNTFWSTYTYGKKGNRAINFYSLIEFYTYYHLRQQGYTPAYIKKFHSDLSKNLSTKYPFASIKVVDRKDRHTRTRQSKIWYEYMGELMRDDRINQPTISSFVKPFLRQIDFGENQLAERFYPFSHTKNIVVDPKHQFGLPVLNGTNIQTQTIFNLYDAGESKKNICSLYDISVNQVEDAIRLHTKKAA